MTINSHDRNISNSKTPNHLILVPCHGIYKRGDPKQRNSWHLANFQIQGNDHLCFIEHIERAHAELEKNPNAYLIFSGGETKIEAGPISEAFSYFKLYQELYNEKVDYLKCTTENYATDSFENVIYSFCRFYEVHGVYPEMVTIVGFEFKRDRFLKLHLHQALGYSVSAVIYIGNSPKLIDSSKEEEEKYFKDLRNAEYNNAYELFKSDWYGIGHKLSKKKISRNPFRRHHGYEQVNHKLVNLLRAMNQSSTSLVVEEQNFRIRKTIPSWNEIND
ncbi:uncharacterized protein KGF55_000596 [Candida pseudojiufengensis]|uniref:uncharacterized protein n=1 Tax=Candida pseudojiufengensis TaxID=497109 RepID=UPI0022248D40|nr:uncharacterized protein KGF55_000596 [Candida pseudojiufengensis]KAI5966287.1 hypothetical protein KGF55_000596 [Candida pseudojiufengensis]